MDIYYSLGTIEPLWYDGESSLSRRGVTRVKIEVTEASADPSFPAVLEVGDLLPYRREKPHAQYAFVLLLEYIVGYSPLVSTQFPMRSSFSVPGAPIIGQIRMALPKEAIFYIQERDDSKVSLKLTLSGVRFILKQDADVG